MPTGPTVVALEGKEVNLEYLDFILFYFIFSRSTCIHGGGLGIGVVITMYLKEIRVVACWHCCWIMFVKICGAT
jgi:hypothetical protein